MSENDIEWKSDDPEQQIKCKCGETYSSQASVVSVDTKPMVSPIPEDKGKIIQVEDSAIIRTRKVCPACGRAFHRVAVPPKAE